MRRAIALATENVTSGRGGPFAAIVVRDHSIVSTGVNQVTATNDPTAHAEIVAIRAACKALGTFQLKGCTVYTSCEPCPMCLAALYWSRCDAVFYGNCAADAASIGFDDSFLYEQVRLPIDLRSLRMERLLPAEALASFQAWRDQPNKIEY
jgi:guanine deaminase